MTEEAQPAPPTGRFLFLIEGVILAEDSIELRFVPQLPSQIYAYESGAHEFIVSLPTTLEGLTPDVQAFYLRTVREIVLATGVGMGYMPDGLPVPHAQMLLGKYVVACIHEGSVLFPTCFTHPYAQLLDLLDEVPLDQNANSDADAG